MYIYIFVLLIINLLPIFKKKQMSLTISFGKQHSPTTSSSVCLARISYMTKDSIQTLCSGKAYLLNFTCK